MFYSQFILAKKGPLGTIWIAAHLERKLRKNQVADTDIGVSVDSILFPDAPIALRLSSHLLLGVVRIYSKKVNYLFNDCSEALIKIKHAFRSTAVDLPPEESTAPYHSITLPENFDLDNFELPDSAFLDSNFVDHHVSTREQITLQDTVNDTAFPTSKFGLDERFGDEDASPIGLELDEVEELFIGKKVSPQHDEILMSSKVGLRRGDTSVPSTTLELDVQFGRREEKYNEIPNELSELLSNNYDNICLSSVEDLRRDVNSSYRHGYTTQTPDLNEIFQPECPTGLSSNIPFTPYDIQTPCLVERAQEPSTPALLEEVIPSHLQEAPALSPQEKAEVCVESGKTGSCSPFLEIKCSEAGNKAIHASAKLDDKNGETAQGLPLSSSFISPLSASPQAYSNCNLISDKVSGAEFQPSILSGNDLNNVSVAIHSLDNEMILNPSVISHKTITLTSPPKLAAEFEAEPATCNICTDNMDESGVILDLKRSQLSDSNETTEVSNLDNLEDGHSCISTFVGGSDFLARSCGSHLHLPGSTFMQMTPFGAEPATSNLSRNNMDVSGDILDMKRTPLRGGNEPTEDASLGHLGVGRSCLSTSVVGSDSISRSCGSNLHLPSSTFVQTAPFESEPASSNICTGNIDVSGNIIDVKRTPLNGSNEPTEINVHHLEDGHSSVSTSVVRSDFFPRSSGSNMSIPSSSFIQRAPLEAEPANSNAFTDNMDVSGVKLDLKRTTQKGSNAISNLGSGDVGSDFLPRSCGSNVHLRSSIFVDGALEDASEISLKNHFFSKKTPTGEEVQHVSRTFEVQGETSRYSNDQFINLEGQHISGYTTSDSKYCARKPNELSTSVISKVSHLDNEKCSSSSEFLGPEKMLAPTSVEFSTYQAVQGADNEATQSVVIVDKNNSQFSRKRPLMDSPSILQNNSSSKLSVLPSSKKRTNYICDDDDVLTTILDGRSATSLNTGSIPPLSLKAGSIPPISLKTDSILSLSKPSSQKRPRMMSKLGIPKRRKVLVDDAMVLHADAIRQQLINTEDIRRMRKKAPCTRPEIWKIYISSMEDDIFDRSILTGVSVELDSLCNLKYDVQMDSSYMELNSQVKTSGDTGSSRALEFPKEMGDNKMKERLLSVHSTVNRSDGPSSISESAAVQTHGNDAQVDLYDQFQKLPVLPEVGPFKNDQASVTGSSRALEFLNDMGDKDRNERTSSVNSINRTVAPSNITAYANVQTHEVSVQHYLYDQVQNLPVHSPAGPFNNNQASVIGSSTGLEFINEMGSKEINERILSVHRNSGPSSTNKSSTMQNHEVGTQYNLYNQLQKIPAKPDVGPFGNDQTSITGSSRAMEFLNDMDDKERNERISSNHITNRNDGPSNSTASVALQTNEVGTQHDLYDQLLKLPIHSPVGPFGNNISSVLGSSMVLGFVNERDDKKISERISSVHTNDGSSSMIESTTVQTREVTAQYNLSDQLQKLPALPQVGAFKNDQASAIGSSGALEFVNDMGDKRRNERLSSVHGTNRNLTATTTVQTNEVGAQLDMYVQLQKLPVHSPAGAFINNQIPVIGSSMEFLNDLGEKEINERILSMHRNDGPSSINESARVQICEVGLQYDLRDQPQKLPVQPQAVSFSNYQDSIPYEMQPDVETSPTSIIQETSITELGKNIYSVNQLTDMGINREEEYDNRARTHVETSSSKFSEFSSDKGGMEMNERISSFPSIANSKFVPSSITASVPVQTHEGGTHCDMHGQLKKLPVQAQAGPFSNDRVSLICTMHSNVEMYPDSIIRGTPIRKCVPSNEKITDTNINMPEGFDSRLKAPGGTGSSRFLDFPNEMNCKEMNERLLTNENDMQYDWHDQLGPFSNDHSSLTPVTQADAEEHANSIIIETSLSEKIDKKLTDKSINLAEKSPHRDEYNPLTTIGDGSVSAECATLVRVDGDILVDSLTSKSLIQTENLCYAASAIIDTEEKTGNVVDIKHLESIHATDFDAGSVVLCTQNRLSANRGTEQSDGSVVVVDLDGALEALGNIGRPVSDVTCAEKSRDKGPASDVTCEEQNINHASSTVDENNAIKDFRLKGGMDEDSMPIDIGAERDSSIFCSAIDDNYTGFLNEDDEAIVNEADDNVPKPEDAQSLENSGWSARTRGVARYLKNLFDEESGQTRKSIAVNRLLVGKTRKEASRMFFETLVLKTRDYIQVEQEKPYEYINIVPRMKLLKSEF